jgi:hypothetical protein
MNNGGNSLVHLSTACSGSMPVTCPMADAVAVKRYTGVVSLE